MQQQFLSVSPCQNNRGISAMTAYNLPHVILNECHNKGYPILAKCHNREPSGCITLASLLCGYASVITTVLLTRPTARKDCTASEDRSCLFDFVSANNHLFFQRTFL